MSSGQLGQLLASKEVIIVCGPGGVGKTTVSAAAGIKAAHELGGRILVLTVDPARRLATALGLDQVGNEATQIDPERLTIDGIEARGELWVAQLDTKASWDDLVRQHAPDAATRDAILANTLYENVTAKFVQSHDYIAMERLHDLHASGDYDLIIIDTPPSRHAVDFLDAPERMAEFFSSRLLRWLTVPYRSKLFTAASKPFYSVADRVLGQQFLREIADFFLLFQTMYKGFVERATEVQRTLRDDRTSFVVVSTLEAASVNECQYFMDALDERDLHLGGVVFNRALPKYFTSRPASTAARKLDRHCESLAAELALGDYAPEMVARVISDVATGFLDFSLAATRQAETKARLVSAPGVGVTTLALLAADASDFETLTTISRSL